MSYFEEEVVPRLDPVLSTTLVLRMVQLILNENDKGFRGFLEFLFRSSLSFDGSKVTHFSNKRSFYTVIYITILPVIYTTYVCVSKGSMVIKNGLNDFTEEYQSDKDGNGSMSNMTYVSLRQIF